MNPTEYEGGPDGYWSAGANWKSPFYVLDIPQHWMVHVRPTWPARWRRQRRRGMQSLSRIFRRLDRRERVTQSPAYREAAPE